MTNPRGVFTDELVPEGWFDETAQAAGWFDQDNLDVAAASGSPYTLPVDTSAVTLTGSTIALRRALKLSVSTAAVTAAGSSVAVRVARKLAVSTAAVTATGSTVSLRATRTLAVSTAAVTLTGSSITLAYASPNKSLAVDTASITLTGSEVGLTYTPASTSSAATGAGGGFTIDSRSPAKVERDRRKQWDKANERRDEIRQQILAAIEPATTEQQIETAEQSDAATITLAERVIARPEGVSPKVLQQVVSLIRELQAAIAAEQARREAAQQEEEAMVMLLLAA